MSKVRTASHHCGGNVILYDDVVHLVRRLCRCCCGVVGAGDNSHRGPSEDYGQGESRQHNAWNSVKRSKSLYACGELSLVIVTIVRRRATKQVACNAVMSMNIYMYALTPVVRKYASSLQGLLALSSLCLLASKLGMGLRK